MSALSVPESTELRCPSGARKLLAKVRTEGGVARRTDGNLLELSCRDCTQKARREAKSEGRPGPLRVLHRFDLAGILVESVEVSSDS